jgi:hypothetical protein
MPKLMEIAELLKQGGYRFVAELTWPKENPDPEDEVHQDKRVKDKSADLLIEQPQEVQHTFTFNLSGERTLLFTGFTLRPKDLYKFIKKIKGEDGSGNLTHISVKFTPKKDPTENDKVVNLGYFQDGTSPESAYRFVAKLYWDPKDDKDARDRITQTVQKVQNQEIPGINPLIQCDILVGEQTAWIVGFTDTPSSLQKFISKIVYKFVIDARVSHATTGPQVNTILEHITDKK